MISIVMITWNKLPFLKFSLPTIIESVSRDDVEIVVVDNGSDDGTRDYLLEFQDSELAEKVVYRPIFFMNNIGLNAYGYIINNGWLDGDIIVTADDDIFDVQPSGWEDIFEKALSTNFDGRKFGYVGSDTINHDGGRVYDYYGLAEANGLQIEIGAVGGWFTATTREVVKEVGGFSTGKPEMYLEDADFQRKAWHAGYLIGTTRNIKVFHACGEEYYKALGVHETFIKKRAMRTEAIKSELKHMVSFGSLG